MFALSSTSVREGLEAGTASKKSSTKNSAKAVPPNALARRGDEADGVLFTGGLVLGIDPGANTGLVCVEMQPRWDLTTARFVGATTVRPYSGKRFTAPERDRDFLHRIKDALEAWGLISYVVLEEPLDGSATWRGGKKFNSRDTAFRLGAYYGLAVSAFADSQAPMSSYPVTSHQSRAGWMSRRSHDVVALQSKMWLRSIGASVEETSKFTDHELMAAGVIQFHAQLSAAAIYR